MSEHNIGIIVQARSGSSRLPSKMLKTFFNGESLIETILQRLVKSELGIPIVVATTGNSLDDKLVELVSSLGLKVFRGNEANVLGRYVEATEVFGFEKVIRICADNPFLDIPSLRYQIKDFSQSTVDYWCYCTSKGIPTIKTHYGFWTEGITVNTLQRIVSETNDPVYMEHVTNYVYTHPEKFKIHFQGIDHFTEKHENVRLTIDTQEDFDLLSEIYSLAFSKNIVNHQDLLCLIVTNEKWLRAMKNQIEQNTK